MDEHSGAGGAFDAFTFTGTWRDYLPIAASNLALTIVTLGIYRFWAKARERRYLWSHTVFVDDTLEWTGTGKEMFLGFLFAMVVAAPLLLFIQFGAQALALRGMIGLAMVLLFASYILLLYLYGVARFRGLRYRLSRSWWHGVRGGSNDSGLAYGGSHLWKTIAGSVVFALLVPWSMTRLWNERWSKMSFGDRAFECHVNTDGLMGRWIVVLLCPLGGGILAIILAASFGGSDPARNIGAGLVGVLLVYGLMALAGLGYYAAYLRAAIDDLELGRVRFHFDADSMDWLKLFLGNIALVVLTLGLGIVFVGYRNWSFFIAHLGASGEIDELHQSTTHVPRDAEGLLDAFDFGAI